ncbi:MAG: poly-gamma-glutamate system protein [Pseudomonadota bacterium]
MKKSLKRIDILLVIAAVILAVVYYGSALTGIRVKDRWYEEKFSSSQLMQQALDVVREEKEKLGILTDSKTDINKTGIIGVEWSQTTTTLGSLEAKRTSANPDFAAVVVDMLKEVGLKEGDLVAMNLSGSFPALNIAAVSAIEVLKLEPVIISSAGASTWGANNPEFTYPDMERVLYERGIFKHKPSAVSLGGADDVGKDMEEGAAEALLEGFRRQGMRIICQPDFSLNLKERLEIYQEAGKPVKCFINIGGNLLSSGGNEDFTRLKTGIVRDSSYSGGPKEKGLIQYYLDRGIPVINLLNIKSLAVQYGVPIDPYPIPGIGEGDIFYEASYPYGIIAVCLAAAVAVLLLYGRRVRG